MKRTSRGFTLIASMMLMLLMSGIAIGLLMMVNTESRVGSNDLQNNLAYHAAEGAIEKMTSDLSTTFQNVQSPQPKDICAVSSLVPSTPGVVYTDYSVTPQSGLCTGTTLNANWGQIQGPPYAGLYAQIIPINLLATAQQGSISREQVSMTRTIEVALIPVFQFGVFSQSDLSLFSSPSLDFQGRVHTNGDLYLGVSNSANLVFHDKITAWGNVINQVFPNGMDATKSSNNDNGNVYIPTASWGCDNLSKYPGKNCIELQQSPNQSSVTGGPTSSQNGSWSSISQGTYNYNIIDGNYGNPGGTGAANLSLPFVSGTTQPFQIIRRPPPGEPTSSLLGQSRLGNQAQIRVLLSDKEADLHLSDWNGDSTQDVQLGGGGTGDPSDATGLTVTGAAGANYWAWANTDSAAKNPGGSAATYDPDFVNYLCTSTKLPVAVACIDGNKQWPLLGGWLLVEAQWSSDGKWHGVTNEWLKYGFARGLAVPNSEAGVANSVHPNAILIFQEMADRNGDGAVSNGTVGGYKEANSVTGSPFNWYPINLYDSREGENWDVSGLAAGSCTVNGVMNAVELDVGNLRKWLLASGAYNTGTGKSVDYVTQNGYVLYFSDRRGMQYDPVNSPTALLGEYGFEDTINLANNGSPDGKLETAMPVPPKSGRTAQSPEDVNDNGTLETYGVKGVGDGFGSTYATDTDSTNPPDPFKDRIPNCYTTARKNRVTGARHVLKLVDGGMPNTATLQSNLPTRGDNNGGGFTVGSENPVFIQGDYNTSASDPMWNAPKGTEPNHSAAAVIADAVTVLSNNWQDAGAPNAGTPVAGSMWSTTNSKSQSAQPPTIEWRSRPGSL